MKVICLHKKAFYELLDKALGHIKTKMEEEVAKTPWINGEEAMEILQIKSTTSLQKLRDHREIRFSQPFRKVILYDRDSIYEFLDRCAVEPT